MNPIRLFSALVPVLICGLALAPAASADENDGRQVRRLLEAGPEEGLSIDAPLPKGLSLNPLQDEDELRYDYRRADYRRTKAANEPPFFDFGKLELGGYIGAVAYTSDFEADPSYVVGLNGRVPVGLPWGEWGIWGNLFFSYIRRDLPFYYNDRSGNWYGGAVGADYTFVRDSIWYLRGQLGILYAHWNDIQALENGIGMLAGVEFGFYWIKRYNKAVVSITPQLSFDGDNAIMFLQLGFHVDF